MKTKYPKGGLLSPPGSFGPAIPPTTAAQALPYRPDIDGLRAVAVGAVIIFHLAPSALSGGFLGVDVFFVISGFLITSIVWREILEGEFSIAKFYDRRIRRIMPALLLVLLVTTIGSAFVLLPADLNGYAKSLVATIGFVANFYFWRDTDYFAPAAEEKPLLHMWSLGIEEQFYVLFPLLLILLGKYWRRGALLTLAVLTIASFLLNTLLLHAGGSNPAFFLLPTRAWELGVGATLALFMQRGVSIRPRLAKALALLGVIMLVAALTRLISMQPLPAGTMAVAGTVLLIVAGAVQSSPINRILRLQPVVFVGLISFALYLWHWPIFVLTRYYLTRELFPMEIIMVAGATVGLAVLSWRFLESPLRDKSVSMRSIRIGTAAAAVGLMLAAGGLLWGKGFPNRLPPEATLLNQAVGTHYRCPVSGLFRFGSSRACEMNLPTRNAADAHVVLAGNSHAQMYAPEWARLLEERALNGVLVPLNGCIPATTANTNVDCLKAAQANLEQIKSLQKAKTVVLAFTWWHDPGGLVGPDGATLDNTGNRALVFAVDALIKDLKSAGKRVILIGPVVQPNWNVASITSRSLAFGRKQERPVYLPRVEYERRFGEVLRHYEGMDGITFIRPDRVQCGEIRCDYLLEGRSLFADESHLAAAELHRYRSAFEKAFDGGR